MLSKIWQHIKKFFALYFVFAIFAGVLFAPNIAKAEPDYSGYLSAIHTLINRISAQNTDINQKLQKIVDSSHDSAIWTQSVGDGVQILMKQAQLLTDLSNDIFKDLGLILSNTNAINKSLDGLSGQLSALYSKLNQVKSNLDVVNRKLVEANTSLDAVNIKLNEVKSKLDGTNERLNNVIIDLNQVIYRLDTANTHLFNIWGSTKEIHSLLYHRIAPTTEQILDVLNQNTFDKGAQKVQSQSTAAQTQANSSNTQANNSGSTLLQLFTGFVSAITSASPSSCSIPLNFGHFAVSDVDLCTLPVPSYVQVIGSLIAIALFVPFGMAMFRRFILLFRSFQG